MYKICSKCGVEKPHAEFSKHKGKKDGLHCYCKTCDIERRNNYYNSNKDVVLKQGREYYEKNKEYILKQKRNYRQSNRGRSVERNKSNKRRDLEINGINRLTENEFLELKLLSEEASMLGKGWHLDHIVPLSKGGRHHPDNLQIVRASYNLRKNNNLWQERKYI